MSERLQEFRRIAARPLLALSDGLDWISKRIYWLYLRAAG